MELGKNAHIILQKHLRNKKWYDVFIPRGMRSVGGVSYFINDGNISTKIYLHNYFSLLADFPDVKARWSVDVYRNNGVHVITKRGKWKGTQSSVVDISQIKNTGEFGVISVKIELDDDVQIFDQPHSSVHYAEFTRQGAGGEQRVIIHSLGTPAADVYSYARENYTSGSFLPGGAKPYLILANGSLLKTGSAASVLSGELQFINWKGESLSMKLPEITEPLGCKKVDVFKECPGLLKHTDNKPFSIKIVGRNILSKPFWFLLGENTFIGEHL